MDVCPCTIEIFRDVNQCVRNDEELNELMSKCFQRCCEYSACCVWIIPDIRHTCAFVQEDVWICDIVYLEYDGIRRDVCLQMCEGSDNT